MKTEEEEEEEEEEEDDDGGPDVCLDCRKHLGQTPPLLLFIGGDEEEKYPLVLFLLSSSTNGKRKILLCLSRYSFDGEEENRIFQGWGGGTLLFQRDAFCFCTSELGAKDG